MGDVGGWGAGQLEPVAGMSPGARSGAKLYFQTNRTAVFDQTWPMAEREAFGLAMSQISSYCNAGAVIYDTPRTRGERSGTKSRCSVQLLPVPKAAFFR